MTEQITRQSLINTFFQDPLQHIVEKTKALLLAGNNEECLNFIEMQPVDLVESAPQVLVYKAAAMLFNEYPKQAIEPVLARAEQFNIPENLKGEITAIRAIICSYTDNPSEGIKLSQLALRKIRHENTFFRNIVQRNLGIAYTIKNDLKNANQWFEKLLLSSCQLEDLGGILACYNYLTYIRKVQGCLRSANIIYKKALDFIDQHQLDYTPHGIKIISGYGQLLLYWHEVNAAKPYFNKAIELASETDILYAYTAYQNLCEAHVREKDIGAAFSVLHELQHRIRGKEDLYENIHRQHTLALEARIFLEAGEIDHAMDWMVSSKIVGLHPNDLFSHYGYALGYILPIAANTYIQSGMYENAVKIIKAVIPNFIHQGANSYLIRALCMLALAYEKLSQHEKALNTFQKAITFAEPENNFGDFFFSSHKMLPLLEESIKRETEPEFTKQLINKIGHKSQQWQAHSPILSSLGLSNRELEVLHLIEKGFTNRQISSSLHLSTNTIKTHNLSIYRKLNVNSRNQAVMKARGLGLIAGNQKATGHSYSSSAS